MKIQTPFTAKRILAIVLGLVVLGLMGYMLWGTGFVGDTANEMCFTSSFMLTLGLALIAYGLFGGKEPQIGMIPKSPEDKRSDKTQS